MLRQVLNDETLEHALRHSSETNLRLLTTKIIKVALMTTHLETDQFSGELSSILSGKSVANRENLREQADELDAQIDDYNEQYPDGPPDNTESEKHDLLFKTARILSAICEASDPERSALENTAWCLYEVSFAVEKQIFDSKIKPLAISR